MRAARVSRGMAGALLLILGGMILGCNEADAQVSQEVETNLDIKSAISLTLNKEEAAMSGAPSTTGTPLSENVTATVSTNNITGYYLTMNTPTAVTNLIHTVNGSVIPSTTNSSAASLAVDTWGYNQNSSITNFLAIPPLGNAATIKTTTGIANEDPTTVTFGAKIGLSLAAGTYQQRVIFTATTNEVPALPTVTGFSPTYGVQAGVKPTYGLAGDTIRIYGSSFTSATAVLVGDMPCASFTIVSGTEITCVLPNGGGQIEQGEVFDITVRNIAGKTTVNNIITYDTLENIYRAELLTIETLVSDIIAEETVSGNTNTRIGTALTSGTAVNINGINYGVGWYKITADQLRAVVPLADVSHADYLVKYETSTAGAVMSVPGEIINGSPVHSFNFSGEEDGLVLEGLLTAVTIDSPKTNSAWGQFEMSRNNATYGADGGLILGSEYGVLGIDETKPVGNQLSVGFTVKGAIPQTLIETFPRTIVAISPASGSYLSWIGIRGPYLHVYSYYSGSALSNKDFDSEDQGENIAGFTSIDLRKYTVPCTPEQLAIEGLCDNNGRKSLNGEYLNIYVTSLRKTTSATTYTDIYINGTKVRTIPSGSPVIGSATLTLGDLRHQPERKLKYEGSIYDFAFYSEILSEAAVQQNWQYTKSQLNIPNDYELFTVE